MKIKAFTITELVVAMAISALIATVGYYSISAVGNTLRLKNENATIVEEIQELRFILKYDLSHQHDWIMLGNTLESNGSGIRYVIGETFIRRSILGKEQQFAFKKIAYQDVRNEQTGELSVLKLELSQKEKIYPLYTKVLNDVELQIND